jgi:cytochrome c oxidase assembly factor CtaG
MSPTFDAFLCSWPWAPGLTTAILTSSVIYIRGWYALKRRDPERWHFGRPVAFIGGLLAVFLALASPIETFASLLLQVHMLQHLLLMMVAPPLIWLGWPLLPFVRGLPEPIRTYWVAPLLRARSARRVFALLTRPIVAWPLYVGATWLWHTPRGYELGLSRYGWHVVEHACFIASSLLFWYPVVRPYPSRPHWPRWILFPYLLLADVQNTALAAWLCFSQVVLYPYYLNVPRLGGISALDDQATAGILMWVPGSIAFLLPLFWIGVGFLFDSQRDRARRTPRAQGFTKPASQFDLLRVPLVGRFLRWRFSRPTMQALIAILAVIVVFDGLHGPQISPINLAGVLPWIHWRGLLILSLLVAGNLFCMACPFTLPRTLARRWFFGNRQWPRWLRSKWLAVGLLAAFLWGYEALALWNSPWITAWIAVAYFVAAFVVDSCFAGAAFCKYVCPIGQFNFVQSLVSPLEVRVKQPAVCATCSTKECIRGSGTLPGCETHLYQPRKHGNFDCTFCLDCIHACPHENIGILASVPAQTLRSDRLRSGIGRFSRRPDIAALVIVLSFGAFANAAGMVAPVVEWQDRLRATLGNPPQILITTLFYIAALVVVPLAAVGSAAWLSRVSSTSAERFLTTATRYPFALVPLGFAMWVAHYGFHLFTSCDTIIPATQRFAAGFGWSFLGSPLLQCACCRPASEWITHFEILMLDFGLLLSLYTGFRIAEANTTHLAQAVKTSLPWAILTLLLFASGIWIIFQPMEMRGTLPSSFLSVMP